jgi:UDP-N-acetylmuramyl tripeptide synthase
MRKSSRLHCKFTRDQRCSRNVARNTFWRGTRRGQLILVLFTLASLAANAADKPSSVFIHANCDGKLSSAALSAFQEEIRSSQKYQLISTLDDNGKMGVVAHIEMRCVEHGNSVVAVAMVYGIAKCFGPNNCHSSLTGSTLSVALCDPNTAAMCAQAFFKDFDRYINSEDTQILIFQH